MSLTKIVGFPTEVTKKLDNVDLDLEVQTGTHHHTRKRKDQEVLDQRIDPDQEVLDHGEDQNLEVLDQGKNQDLRVPGQDKDQDQEALDQREIVNEIEAALDPIVREKRKRKIEVVVQI